jgi:gliding motility-associated-like protein
VFKVFNRYGQVIFSSRDFHAGWDGMFKGVQQPAGNYIWMIQGKDQAGITHFKKGSVILIR